MSDRIAMFDYQPSYRPVADAVQDAIRGVLESGQLILGPETQALEDELAEYLGVSHCVAVQSGTAALILALMGLEVGQGDEVITVANTCAPTASAICMAGARPVFAEIDAHTLMIDSGSVADLIGPRTRAIIAVHLWGNAVAMAELQAVADAAGIPIIEDCAQAFGTLIDGKPAGSLGAVGCLSFYPTKNLGAYGDGGAVITNDAALAKRIRSQRMYGYEGRQYSERLGTNARINEMQAAILRIKLARFDEEFPLRLGHAQIYNENLHENSVISVPATTTDVRHAYHQYVIRTSARSELQAHFNQQQIDTGIHYEVPLHRMPAFEHARHDALDITESAAAEILSLPVHENLRQDQVERVVRALVGWAGID